MISIKVFVMGRSFFHIIVPIAFNLMIFGCGGGGGGSDSESGTSPVSNGSGVTCEDRSYTSEKIMSPSFGLPKQISMLPDGRMVLTDPANNRIIMIEDDDSVKVLVDSKLLYPHAVVALPNGKVCFTYGGGRVLVVDPDTKLITPVTTSRVSPELFTVALACDKNDAIFAAMSDSSIYRITGTLYRKILQDIPIQGLITDIEVSDDDILYISGSEKVVAYRSNQLEVIADGLGAGPVFIDVSPDGILYISETSQGLQKYNPSDGTLTRIPLNNIPIFGDIISAYPDQIKCHTFQGLFYDYDLIEETIKTSYISIGSNCLITVNDDDSVNITTPGMHDVFDQYVVNINQSGIIDHRKDLSYNIIRSVSTDYQGRLCLSTDEGLKRVEKDGQITNIADNLQISHVSGILDFSVGPNGLWYIATTDYHDNLQVSIFDETGTFEATPISFSRESFEGSELWDASIDVGPDGSIAVIISGTASGIHGPFFETVYRADEDGNNLTLVANLNSDYGGPVDIALGNNNEIYTFCSIENMDNLVFICRIDHNNDLSKFVSIQADNPFSLDTGQKGSLWFSASQGVFRVYPK
jgi:hypothetical protein